VSAPTSFYLGKRADLYAELALQAKEKNNFAEYVKFRELTRKYRERAGQLEVELCEF
jgi:hypothetical protein